MPEHHYVYDYHEHERTQHIFPAGHNHDDPPRHYHDPNGSIHYLDIFHLDSPVDIRRPALIGESGYDITHRTP